MNAERAAAVPLDIAALRAEFPQLRRKVHGIPLIYFDNANTAQKPQCVIDCRSITRKRGR